MQRYKKIEVTKADRRAHIEMNIPVNQVVDNIKIAQNSNESKDILYSLNRKFIV